MIDFSENGKQTKCPGSIDHMEKMVEKCEAIISMSNNLSKSVGFMKPLNFRNWTSDFIPFALWSEIDINEA